MQVYDHEDRVVAVKTGELESLLKEKEQLLRDPEVKKVVIDRMPAVNDTFHIDDLLFIVTQIRSRGRISAKVVGA